MQKIELLYGPLDGEQVEVAENQQEWRPTKDMLIKYGFPNSKPVYVRHLEKSFIYAFDDRQPPTARMAVLGDD